MLAGIDNGDEKQGEDKMSQQTYNVSENVHIEIRNCQDRVTVIGWDDGQHVSLDCAARQEGDAIIVEDVDKAMLRVPRRAAVMIGDTEADVRVEDLDGRVELEHIGGDVALRSLRGEVIAHDIEGDLAARDVASIKSEGSWDGDVSLHSVKSFQAEEVEGSVTMSDVESATVDKVKGDVSAKGVKSLKGAAEWEGDLTLREVESTEVDKIEGDASISELGAVKIREIEGDLNAFSVHGSIAIDQVKGNVNLREVSGSVSLDRVEGDLIASGIRGALHVVEIEGDAVVSMSEIAPMELRADGDVVINLPEQGNAEIELDAPRGDLVANADIQVDHDDANHVSGRLGNGGVKIRAESVRRDLILRAGGMRRHHIHASVRHEAFANMGQEIAQQVRDSMRESFRGWRISPRISASRRICSASARPICRLSRSGAILR